jgi:predicted acyl esterase
MNPAHKAMVEMAGATAAGTIPGYRDQGIFYHGGVPDLAWTWWYHRYGLKQRPMLPAGAGLETRQRRSACSDQVAREQSQVEARQDVLVYSSDEFTETTPGSWAM